MEPEENMPVADVKETAYALKTGKNDEDGDDELPNFNGSEVIKWHKKAEAYFATNSIPSKLKVRLAMTYMKGPALTWCQFLLNSGLGATWNDFSTALFNRFTGYTRSPLSIDPSLDDSEADVVRKLASINQLGTVDDYIDRFVAAASGCYVLGANLYGTLFKGGLHTDVRMFMDYGVKGIMNMVVAARLAEEEMKTKFKSASRVKYDPNLVCDGTVQFFRKSSLLKFKGFTAGKSFTVLFSPDTSHNLISSNLVTNLKKKVKPTVEQQVRLNDDTVVSSSGVCKKFDFTISEFVIVADFIPLDLVEGVDLVLGEAWLKKIGNCHFFADEWGLTSLSFVKRNRQVVLHAED